MNLSVFEQCNPSHNFEYCCMRSNKISCQQCWYSEKHFYHCFSSQCGHYEKLAHQVIERLLQMKVMHCTSEMSSSFQVYQRMFKSFYLAKEIITNKVKQDVESKLPLFLWTAILEMLGSKQPKLNGLAYQQSTCNEMLKLIKSKKQSKSELLEQAIKGLQKTIHAYQGLKLKLKEKQYTGAKDQQMSQIMTFYGQQGNRLMTNLRDQMKKHSQLEIKKFLQKFNPQIKFDGVKFNSKRSFQQIECYNSSLNNILFPILNRKQTTIPYNGMIMDIQKLQQTPQMMLQTAKSMLKSKVFSIYNSITEMKSLYPYKYAYIVGTTIQADPEYQLAILNLDKFNIKMYEKTSQYVFLNSVNLIIMGPELITAEARNYPKRMTEICIYGYDPSREKHYNQIIQSYIGLIKDKQIRKIVFQQKLTPTELIYVQFQLAYQHLFIGKEAKADFEGQRLALGRGIKLFDKAINDWKTMASIDFPIQKNKSDYLPLFI